MFLAQQKKLFSLALLLVALVAVAGGAQQSPRVVTSSGTGFIVGADGYILTNNHVIDKATSLKVRIAGTDVTASVVQKKPDQDLALLKISKSGLQVAALGDSDKVQVGEQVVAIGCPEGRCGTITVGRVANLGQTGTFPGGVTLRNLIMIDVTIAPGSSGGPLFNMKGEVIGITMGGIPDTRFGFAIPINDAISLLQQVPGFNRSKMGQATQELSISQIVAQMGPSVTYIEAKHEVPLRDLLPRQALGFELLRDETSSWNGGGTPNWQDPREVLRGQGVTVEGAERVFHGPIVGALTPGSDAISVAVFDVANQQQAGQAAQLLSDPNAILHPKGPLDASGNRSYDVCVSRLPFSGCTAWARMYEHYVTIVRKSDNLSGTVIQVTVNVFALEQPVGLGPIRYFNAIGLQGAATFSLGDLTFFSTLHNFGTFELGQIDAGSLRCGVTLVVVECRYTKSGRTETTTLSSLKADSFLSSLISLINATLSAATGGQ